MLVINLIISFSQLRYKTLNFCISTQIYGFMMSDDHAGFQPE